MADISVTCSGCGAGIQVSEFADSVVCRSCGRSTPVPKAVAPAPVAGAEVQPGAGSGLRAFEDSVLQGAMCVLLPPYAFYYLFAFCDLFVLRGLYLGVLAGVGLDTFVVVRELAIAVNRSVTTWIMSGG